MQGLAFWIGHRRSLFRGYPLSEGALVAETCNLIQANKPDDLILMPERMYKNLVPAGVRVEKMGALARADLVLCKNAKEAIGWEGNISEHTKFVIEVKRGNASKRSIDKDLLRLHSFLNAKAQDARCFLLIASEGMVSRRFIYEGIAIRGQHQIPNCNGHYCVRRVVKAAASLKKRSAAHYVCLLEVFVAGQ
jgi:hypothetical protein